MTIEEMETANVWPYVGIYILTTIVLSIILIVLTIMFPSAMESAGKAMNFVVIFASTSTTYSFFVKRKGRVFSRQEYWRIVSFSTMAALLFSGLLVLFSIATGAFPEIDSIPAGAWILILAFAVLLVFGLNAAGYSKRFGNNFLKAHRAKQTPLDIKPFQ
ncbi:MAG: ABZJ_00895 family protein [Mesorhizobium sp.]